MQLQIFPNKQPNHNQSAPNQIRTTKSENREPKSKHTVGIEVGDDGGRERIGRAKEERDRSLVEEKSANTKLKVNLIP